MKKILLNILTSVLFIYSVHAQKSTFLSCRILNAKDSTAKLSIYIISYSFEEKLNAPLDVNNEFVFELNLTDTVFAEFSVNYTFDILLYPGDSLVIEADGSNFYETLKFSGRGAEKNNFLLAKYLRYNVGEKGMINAYLAVKELNPVDYKKELIL
jgi:hypothetical protein